MMRHSRQRGFALLVTLMLVMLLGAVLVGVAWRSMVSALDAQAAVEEVQRRWAVSSCQAVLLERAEELLKNAEAVDEARRGRGRTVPVAMLRVSCEFAGRPYELMFTDEQAKLNVNTLLHDPASARAVVRKLSDASPSVTVRLRAEELVGTPVGRKSPAAAVAHVQSYGQVFENALPAELASGLTDAITCWGSGAVNIRRASDAVLAQACGKALGPRLLAEFLAARRQDPSCELPVLLGRLDKINEKQKEQLSGRLTDQASCHGLWVIARGGQRSWYAYAVGTGTASSGPGTEAPARRGGSGVSAGGVRRAPASQPTDPESRAGRGNIDYRFTW